MNWLLPPRVRRRGIGEVPHETSGAVAEVRAERVDADAVDREEDRGERDQGPPVMFTRIGTSAGMLTKYTSFRLTSSEASTSKTCMPAAPGSLVKVSCVGLTLVGPVVGSASELIGHIGDERAEVVERGEGERRAEPCVERGSVGRDGASRGAADPTAPPKSMFAPTSRVLPGATVRLPPTWSIGTPGGGTMPEPAPTAPTLKMPGGVLE